MVLLTLDSCIKTAWAVLSTAVFADHALFVGLSVRKKDYFYGTLINFCSVGPPVRRISPWLLTRQIDTKQKIIFILNLPFEAKMNLSIMLTQVLRLVSSPRFVLGKLTQGLCLVN